MRPLTPVQDAIRACSACYPEGGNRPVTERIYDVLGKKLFFKPAIEPSFQQSPIFGTRPKSAPVEDMVGEVDFILGRGRTRWAFSICHTGGPPRGELFATSGRCKRKQSKA